MLRQILIGLCALSLAACQMGAPDEPAADVNPITGDEISVTSLDAPLVEGDEPAPVEGTPADLADPVATEPDEPVAEDTLADAVEEEATPVVVKSPQQIQCERRGGTWARAGKSEARTCVKQTRDGGKQCTRGTQCEGLCLARSGTCAPVIPLFGCNDVLEDDGRRVTLCID